MGMLQFLLSLGKTGILRIVTKENSTNECVLMYTVGWKGGDSAPQAGGGKPWEGNARKSPLPYRNRKASSLSLGFS